MKGDILWFFVLDSVLLKYVCLTYIYMLFIFTPLAPSSAAHPL